MNYFITGPMAHLFAGVHEQNFVPFVIAYASKIGDYYTSGSQAMVLSQNVLLITIIVTILHKFR